MNISVCLATYNGASFLKEQLDSILIQLQKDDELIIVDDCSTDNTINLIKSYNDCRIKLFINKANRGVNFSFERAIALSHGDFIFLSDQDDIWPIGRINVMLSNLKRSNALLLSSNFTPINIDGNIYDGYNNYIKFADSQKYIKNILDIYWGKPNYFGCTMAFSSKLKEIILPFPSFIESHDLWIAFAGNLLKSNLHIDDISLYHRVHGNNLSITSRTIYKKILSRFIFTFSIIILFTRIIKKKN